MHLQVKCKYLQKQNDKNDPYFLLKGLHKIIHLVQFS